MDKGIINANVTLVNGVPMVSSLDVAEKFEKPHADVLKAIRKLLADLPKEFNEGNFSLVEYVDDKGEKRPMYNLTRDAFSLLAMGFTGKKALAWKVKYIEAFNAMEAELLKTAKKRVEHKKARHLLSTSPNPNPATGITPTLKELKHGARRLWLSATGSSTRACPS